MVLTGGDFTMLGGQTRNHIGRIIRGDELRIQDASLSGTLTVTGAFPNGVCTIERAETMT